jgi:recombination protein RecA
MGKKKLTALEADKEALGALCGSLTESYGSGGVVTASLVASGLPMARIPTQVWEVNKATGGGWPVCRFSLVKGWESSAKTTLLLGSIAEAQGMCGSCYQRAELHPGAELMFDPETGEVTEVETMVVDECDCGNPRSMRVAFVDQEGDLDLEWASAIGVIPERMLMSFPVHAEECVDVIDAYLATGLVDVVVLDSIAAMRVSDELEQSAVDSFEKNPGKHARIMGSAYRKWNAHLAIAMRKRLNGEQARLPSVWVTNQLRQKIMKPGEWGSDITSPGGNAPRFYSSVVIDLKKGKVKAAEKADAKLLETYWAEIGWKVEKNKVGAAKQAGKFRICEMETGPHRLGDVLDHPEVLFNALRWGVVERPNPNGNKYVFYGEEINGKQNLIERWEMDRGLYQRVKDDTMAIALRAGKPSRVVQEDGDEA